MLTHLSDCHVQIEMAACHGLNFLTRPYIKGPSQYFCAASVMSSQPNQISSTVPKDIRANLPIVVVISDRQDLIKNYINNIKLRTPHLSEEQNNPLVTMLYYIIRVKVFYLKYRNKFIEYKQFNTLTYFCENSNSDSNPTLEKARLSMEDLTVLISHLTTDTLRRQGAQLMQAALNPNADLTTAGDQQLKDRQQ
uniref:Uncharacterized protein n=1 Tax=Glossina austeni TaxID=7395 RepID=A0A1A9UTS5_GLOAU